MDTLSRLALLLLLATAPAVSRAEAQRATVAPGDPTQRPLTAGTVGTSNAKVLGAEGDGVSIDFGPLTSGIGPMYLPPGIYYTGATLWAMPGGRWYSVGGVGRLATLEGGVERLGPPNLSVIRTAPATNPGYSDRGMNSAFDGDLSRVHLAAATLISGAATLGQPASGYHLSPLASQIYLNLASTSGWNQSTKGNAGRTGVVQQYLRFSNFGAGDMASIFCNGHVTGVKPGATSFLANAAGGCVGGQITAGANGVYLQGFGDLNLNDQGHDVSGIGLIINSNRTNGTGALGATWMAIRPQSSGSVAIDAFYSAGGKARIGIDLTGMRLQDLGGAPVKSAIMLKAGQAIYGNATNTDPTTFARYTQPGTEWLSYDTATGWNLVAGSVPVLQAAASGVSAAQLRITTPGVPATSSDACAKGQIAYDSSYLYICVATNSWKRSVLAAW